MLLGELAALTAALCWTINSIIVERKGRRSTPNSLNLGKMLFALIVYIIYIIVAGKTEYVINMNNRSRIFLILSGLIGFSFGDTFLFHAFQRIGARLTLLIFTFSPVLTAILSYFIFGENLNIRNIVGMLLVLSGIVLVIMKGASGNIKADTKGITFAFIASLGQAVGLLFSKAGMSTVDPLIATQHRLIGGLLGMIILCSIQKDFKSFKNTMRSPDGRMVVISSALLATCIGVLLSMYALKMTKAAIASTLISTTPILIIPIGVFFLKEKVTRNEVLGSIISVLGVALLF